MFTRRTLLVLTGLCSALNAGRMEAQARPARYRLDSLTPRAVAPNGQVREGRLAPIAVDLHNSGNGPGSVDVTCTAGTATMTGSAPTESLGYTATIFVMLPAGTTAPQAPRGRLRVDCRARARGRAGDAPGGTIAVTRELDLQPPALPDYALAPDPSHPGGAFDCDSEAPAVATRNVCVSFTSRERVGTAAAGAPSIRCALDGNPLPPDRAPGSYHAGPLSLGRLDAGRHVLRCTVAAPHPEWEADRSNDALEVAFEVGDEARWHSDLAIVGSDRATHPATFPAPQVGPPGDSPPGYVPAVAFGVRVRNVGVMRVFAVDVSCRTRPPARQPLTFAGVWARPGGDRGTWLRGLDPGEEAMVEVVAPGSPVPDRLDLECEVRTAAPRFVPDRNARNDRRRARVSIP